MNPLLEFHADAMRRIKEAAAAKGHKATFISDRISLLDLLMSGQAMSETALREKAITTWAYGVPNDEALDAIAALSPIVEVGAGSGYWASLLAERGADVVAYETWEWSVYRHGKRYYDVRLGDARKAVREHVDRALLMVWPPMEPWTGTALRTYRKAGGRALACVTEGSGGCCGSDGFWNEVERHWREVRIVAIPVWAGMHDYLALYERKGGAK